MSICPPMLNMKLLVECFPSLHPVTVYRWRNAKGASRLPDPDLEVGGVAFWNVDTIVSWAEGKGLPLSVERLDAVCQTQLLQ